MLDAAILAAPPPIEAVPVHNMGRVMRTLRKSVQAAAHLHAVAALLAESSEVAAAEAALDDIDDALATVIAAVETRARVLNVVAGAA